MKPEICLKLFKDLKWKSSLGVCHIFQEIQRIMEEDTSGVYIKNPTADDAA